MASGAEWKSSHKNKPPPTMRKRSARKRLAQNALRKLKLFRDETHRCVILLLRPASRDNESVSKYLLTHSPLKVQQAFRPTGNMKIFPSQPVRVLMIFRRSWEALDDASYRPYESAGGSISSEEKHDSCPFQRGLEITSRNEGSNSYGCQEDGEIRRGQRDRFEYQRDQFELERNAY